MTTAASDALALSRDEATRRGSSELAGPVKIVVSISRQRLSLYDGLRKVAETPVSTGQSGHATPTGIFNIIQKNRVHYSNLYNDAPMPFMQRITWSGVALHAGHLPGYPASHGCIRLPHNFANQLFGQTRIGARVVVARDDVAPEPFQHARMFRPLPPGNDEVVTPVAARTAHQDGSVALLVGVANAAAAPGDPAAARPIRTRRMAAEERAAEIASLKASLTGAEAAHQEALERSQSANRAAESARGEARRVRGEMDEIRRAIERTERTRSGLEQQFAVYVRRNLGKAEQGASDAMILSENEFEARLAALETELEALQHDLDDQALHVPRIESVLAEADRARQQAAHVLSERAQTLRETKDRLASAERAQAKRELPASIFISRKSGKLYVRQGFEPIFDAPVAFESPDSPIGTHVLTALSYAEGEAALAWSSISIPHAAADTTARPTSKRSKSQPAEAKPEPKRFPQTAAVALERLRIAPETMERIAEIIKPGSSVVISDLPLSNETGKGTDHIVLTH